MALMRTEIGDSLRAARKDQKRTLRDVSADARVSLGYLSEIERGQKEASSELLASICSALNMPVSLLLRQVSDRLAIAEGVHASEMIRVPDTVPPEISAKILKREAPHAIVTQRPASMPAQA